MDPAPDPVAQKGHFVKKNNEKEFLQIRFNFPKLY